MKKSPFIYTEPVIPPIFAGRENELLLINNALFEEKESLVIYGNDAIGKSSIVSTIHNNLILKEHKDILSVRINAFDFIRAVESDFLSITTHQICAAIWTKLMKRKYSELIEYSFNQKIDSSIKPTERSLKRIFRIVTSEKLTGVGSSNREFGGKLIVEGKVSQHSEVTRVRKPLASFEFLHLLDELNDIIKEYHYSSIIVFCDELNHLPEKVNTNILRNYFSVFASKQIQFVIIAVNPEKSNIKDALNLIESFNYNLEIKPFKSVVNVQELLDNSLNTIYSNVVIENGVSEFLFNFTDGHPWWIQKISDKVFKSNQDTDSVIFDLKSVEINSNFFTKEIAIYNERIKQGLPFRKYNLRQ